MDWATVASLATAGGTLVLAVATFESTRSANRAARVAEQAMLAGLRPLLVSSRRDDPVEKVIWTDDHFSKVPGGQAVIEQENGIIYMAANLRNAGAGVAVLHGWHLFTTYDPEQPHAEPDDFRRQTRDILIPPGDTGFWQGALRDAGDPDRPGLLEAMEQHRRIMVEILYGDNEGGQRSIARMLFTWYGEGWMCVIGRHWNLDRADPR